MSAEAALELVTMPSHVTARLFHATSSDGNAPATAVERAWVEF